MPKADRSKPSNKLRLTKRAVEQIEPGSSTAIYRDTDLPGFGLKVTSSGRRVYFYYYRTTGGRERRPNIGRHGDITCEQARQIARDWAAKVRLGGDPSGERIDDRQSETFDDFSKRYMEYVSTRKKASSLATDQLNLDNHLLPALGRKKVAAIEHRDVVRLHQSLKHKPGAANRTLALLSHMLNVAERWDIRSKNSNPCRDIEKFKLKKRERYLSSFEIALLSDVLAEAERTKTESKSAIAAIRLLLLTGARLSEILTLKWDYVDFEGQRLNLPDSKTGAKTIHLSPPALEVLSNIERQKKNPFVIYGAKQGERLINLRKPWLRLRERATLRSWKSDPDSDAAELVANLHEKLGREPTYNESVKEAKAEGLELPVGFEDVRIHDLRHSFASMAVASGLSLPMIGALLGHTQPRTTHRYAHLAADPLKEAANLAAGRIAGAMQTTPQAIRTKA